jgi:glutamyl-tRNA reductase
MLVEPLISKIYKKIEETRKRELERAFSKIRESDEKKRLIIDRFSRELAERILQFPAQRLREAVLENRNDLLSAAEELFAVKLK